MFKDEIDIHFEPGEQIAYVPLNEARELKANIVQYGFVTSTHINASDARQTVFCRFWNKELDDLRTKDNSEGCDWYDLIHCSAVDSTSVKAAWRTYVSPTIIPTNVGWVDVTGSRVAPAVGALATVCYADNLHPAIVVNVKLEQRVSKSHGKLVRVPVRIDVAVASIDELTLPNLRPDRAAGPLFDSLLTGAQVLANLPKKRKLVKAAFDAKAQMWRGQDAATIGFGVARYRHDYAP